MPQEHVVNPFADEPQTDRPDTEACARLLLSKGWNPFPLPAGQKKPPPDGITGYRGRDVTAADVDRWDWTGNIGLRVPADVIGVDVDSYKGADLGALAKAAGVDLPATIWSTSRDDGSGIAFFRVPVGTTLKANPAEAIEIIQTGHRYAVTWPSIHPDTGRMYEWVDESSLEVLDTPPDIDDLPELPFQWIEHLFAVKGPTAQAATPQAVAAFAAQNTTAAAPGRLKGVQAALDAYSGSRHDTLVEVACWAMREAAAGCYPADDAIRVLETWWHRVMDNPARLDDNEFGACISWATAQASLDPGRVAEIRADVAQYTQTAVQVAPPAVAPPANVDPVTGEFRPTAAGVNLPEQFWAARPVLSHIRQAAHARLACADAVLAAVLARVVTLVPSSIALPPLVGGRASLNLFAAIIDPSGGGKSAAVSVASELVPIDRKDIRDPLLPGSGEGIIDDYFEMVAEENADGKKELVKKQTQVGAFMFVDEGETLLAQNDRKGATIMQTLRSAWMGGALGQANATQERKRFLPAHNYRLCTVVGFQLHNAAMLINDGGGGTPQRFWFVNATDPAVCRQEWPGPIRFYPPPRAGDVDMTMDDEIADGIIERRIGRTAGRLAVDPLDTHGDLRREKIAAALAILDGRMHIGADDWDLAGMIDDASVAVRSTVIAQARQAAEAKAHQRTVSAVKQEVASRDALEAQQIARGSRALARLVWKAAAGGVSKGDVWRALSGQRRKNVSVDELVDHAVGCGWVVEAADLLSAGATRP